MAQNKESKLWNDIKNINKDWHFTRIESSTINGIPDVHCVVNMQVFCLELKANTSKNCGLSKYQINWHLTHFKNGGQSFILREDLSQRPSQNLQIFVIREPRTLFRAYSSLTLSDAMQKIQDA